MIFNFSVISVRSVDRVIVSYFLGNKQLGYYGIAVIVLGFFMQIPGSSREVIEPRLMQNLKEKSDEENIREYFFKPLINTAYFMPILMGPIFFIFPVLIPLLLPKYIPSIQPTQIIVLGAYFLALSYITRGFIVANNWQLQSLVILLLSFIVNIAMSILFIKSGFGISGVAVSSSISYFILFISLLVFIRRGCRYALEDWKTHLIALCMPFPVMCGAIVFLHYISTFLFTNIYLASLFKMSLFCIIMFVVINIAGKRYPLLKRLYLREIL
jgi:O-antigen/teichoic acid export membrane protein